MTSIDSSISIETELLTNFSVCKIITLFLKIISYVLTMIFAFLRIEALPNFVEAYILNWLL